MKKEKKLSRKTIIIIGIVTVALVGLALGIYFSIRAAVEKPHIALLVSNGKSVTINPDTEERRYVFCLNRLSTPLTCEWENFRDFEVEEEGVYYAFIKDLDNGAISDYELFEYKAIDYEHMRI